MCYILSNRSEANKKRRSSTFIYYLIQVLLSILIISWVFYANKERHIIRLVVCLAIIRKVGIWPFHGWYIKLIITIEIKQKAIIVIITWQKILPIMLVIAIKITASLTIAAMLIIGGTILASLSRLNYKIEIKKIIAISSINNNSWILLRALVSNRCFFTFILVYSTALLTTLKILEKIKEKYKHLIKNFWINTLIVRNISGLPPLALFWGKITVVKIIIKRNMPREIALVLILSACLLIYHYLWITIGETSHTPEKSQINLKTTREIKIMIVVIVLRVRRALIFITSGLTKKGLSW